MAASSSRNPANGAGAVPLTAETILRAAESLLLEDGGGSFTLRELGESLGVHNTAVYRHFRDKHELLRAVADRVLAEVAESADAVADPFEAIQLMCTTLRTVLLARPAAARVLAEGPARQQNELRLTENMLARLRATGLPDLVCVDAYHALVEYAVGSSVVDQPVASMAEADRSEVYRRWRSDYLGLDGRQFPHLVELAATMYHGAGEQFDFGLGLMLESLRRLAFDLRQS